MKRSLHSLLYQLLFVYVTAIAHFNSHAKWQAHRLLQIIAV